MQDDRSLSPRGFQPEPERLFQRRRKTTSSSVRNLPQSILGGEKHHALEAVNLQPNRSTSIHLLMLVIVSLTFVTFPAGGAATVYADAGGTPHSFSQPASVGTVCASTPARDMTIYGPGPPEVWPYQSQPEHEVGLTVSLGSADTPVPGPQAYASVSSSEVFVQSTDEEDNATTVHVPAVGICIET